MPNKTIVILLQEGSSSYGEVHEFDQAQDAERYIESLLEASLERPRVLVLEAQALNLTVTQKAFVSLFAGRQPAVSRIISEERTETIALAPEPEPVAEDAKPYHRDGVRF